MYGPLIQTSVYITDPVLNLRIFGIMQHTEEATENILSRLNIEGLNEMQVAYREATQNNPNIMLLADTGTGKTLAFLLPLVQLMDPLKRKTQSLIIVPSRELAMQIENVFKSMGTKLKVTCCYGGHKREIEENNLTQAPALLIGTPGRLADHIRRGSISTETIESLILDEFDKSLEMGFSEEMSFIIGSLKNLKKRTLTSATDTIEIPEFVGLENLLKLDFLSDKNTETNKLAIKLLKSDGKDKLETLFRLICFLGNRSTIVFCNHRESVERTSNLLKEKDIVNVFYHGAMEQQERDAALCKFRNGLPMYW